MASETVWFSRFDTAQSIAIHCDDTGGATRKSLARQIRAVTRTLKNCNPAGMDWASTTIELYLTPGEVRSFKRIYNLITGTVTFPIEEAKGG